MRLQRSSATGLAVRGNRRNFVRRSLFGAGAGWLATRISSWSGPAAEVSGGLDLLGVLRRAGVPETAREIGLDFERLFAPLAVTAGCPYQRYRWSVSYAAAGGPLIQALPPEEEMGWTPWEEWFALAGRPRRRAMVLYPVRQMTRQVPSWWCLEQSETNLSPRCATPARTLAELFGRDRILEAAAAVGFDAKKLILDPLSPRARAIYLQMRWSIAPHRLAADLPVIQCLPPRERAHQWPWETWYTDGQTPLIHHVHYAKPSLLTHPKAWRERDGAPQRPLELFGLDWYWYNDESMTPALAKAG
jgi:hypothetical protein